MATAIKPPAQLAYVEPAVSAEVYFARLAELIPRLPYDAINAIAGALFQAVRQEQTIFVFGNGGSAASASHMMCDLNKGAAAGVTRPRVIALTDNVPLLTAWANDHGYDQVFAEQLRSFVRRGDVAFAISASGDSENVAIALKAAREFGAFNVGLCGFNGGRMKPLCDLCAIVPSDNMQWIEDLHHAMLHSVFTVLRGKLTGSGRKTLPITAGRLRS